MGQTRNYKAPTVGLCANPYLGTDWGHWAPWLPKYECDGVRPYGLFSPLAHRVRADKTFTAARGGARYFYVVAHLSNFDGSNADCPSKFCSALDCNESAALHSYCLILIVAKCSTDP